MIIKKYLWFRGLKIFENVKGCYALDRILSEEILNGFFAVFFLQFLDSYALGRLLLWFFFIARDYFGFYEDMKAIL